MAILISMAMSVVEVLCVSWFLVGTIGVCGKDVKQRVVRFKDTPFQNETLVLNTTVTCGNKAWGQFSSVAYTCDDIRVNGSRLAYGYYPGWGVDEDCEETEGKQELAQLCRLLLIPENQHQHFFAVFVNNATCARTPEPRYVLERISKHRHKFRQIGPGNGWLSSISCLVRKSDSDNDNDNDNNANDNTNANSNSNDNGNDDISRTSRTRRLDVWT